MEQAEHMGVLEHHIEKQAVDKGWAEHHIDEMGTGEEEIEQI